MNKLFFLFLIVTLVSCRSGNKKAQPGNTTTDQVQTAEATINISGIHCEMCVASIENGVKELEGIVSVKASLTDSNAVVSFDPSKVDIEKIRKAIEGRGYSIKPGM